MCENDYVHMDNHPKNLGFARAAAGGGGGGEPLVFDFGLTQKRVMTKRDKRWALALSLFIIIEHASSVADIRGSFLYKAALTEMLGRHSLVDAREYAPAAEAAAADLLPTPKQLESELASEARSFKGPNQDVYDACLNYVRLLALPRRVRYDHPLYSRVYDIRNNLPTKPTEGVLAELLQLPPPQSSPRRRRHGD